jgi:hypothetical protein
LLLENDINTYGYTNWFFFRVKNKIKDVIQIHIINLIKKAQTFNQGMMISVFSMKKSKQNMSWHKGGDKITLG